jgi:Na+-driven multidrug efflux pump
MKRNFQVNMCEGSILKNLLVFAFPLLAANILQLLFNAADITVLGKFIPDAKMADAAVGAVGSTNALINLIIGLFVGFSVGANVLVARCVGENDENRSRRIVGTSMSISIIIGIFLAVNSKTYLQSLEKPNTRTFSAFFALKHF